MSRKLAVLLCPGRGAYARDELGFLGRTLVPGPVHDALMAADGQRRAAGKPALLELDAADKFRPGLHLDGENAAALIYFSTLAHVERLRERYEIAAVAGNSLGWYTALAASGAATADDGWRLVRTMAALQLQVEGGQVLTTTVGDDWQSDAALAHAVATVVDQLQDRSDELYCDYSIRLGGHEVLAGTEAAVAELLRAPVGHVVLREGWRGLRDKQALFASGVIAVD